MEPHLPAHPLTPAALLEGPRADARAAARVGLYVHVPFCAARCTYCDFSSGALAGAAIERWLAGLERETERRAPAAAGVTFTSVFFGGGTPSALPARDFQRAARAIVSRFEVAPDAEVTLEANPESVRPERLAAWARAGVNRLSMGAQSFHADELALLGRIHPRERPAEAFARARAHGFQRLSLDLMFGFPGHTMERWRETIARALELAPEHLSAYCLIPEPGTPLGDAVLSGSCELPSPESQAELYVSYVEAVAGAGLARYETSNASLPGAEARHNLTYWLRRPYLGLGPSAHGLWEGERYGNHAAPGRWAAALEAGAPCEAERQPETAATVADEVLMLALRLSTGLRPADYPPDAWRAVEARHGRGLAEAVATGRLERHADGWCIPADLRFLADDAIAWIAARAEAREFDSPKRRSVPWPPCPSPPSPVT